MIARLAPLLMLGLAACPSDNEAIALGFGGYADTDLAFSEFFGADHTVMVRFMAQYPRGMPGPILAANGEGTYFVGLEEFGGADPSPRLVMAIGGSRRAYPVSLEPGTWHHLGVVRRGNEFRLLLDGEPLGQELPIGPGDPGLPVADTMLRLGRQADGATYWFSGGHRENAQFYGLIDDVVVIAQPLPDAEVAALAAQSRLVESQVAAMPVVGAYTFDLAGVQRATFQRPVVLRSPADLGTQYEGVGVVTPAERVPVSSHRHNARDAERMLPPMQENTFVLPFAPGVVGRVGQGNSELISHHAFAVFSWDLVLGHATESTWVETGPMSTCGLELHAQSGGWVSQVVDNSWNETRKDSSNVVRMQAGSEATTFMHVQDGSATTRGWAAVDWVLPGDEVAAVGTREADNCHLHVNTRVWDVSIPIAYRDYEVSRDRGATWTPVARGVPRTGEWIRSVATDLPPSVEIVAPGPIDRRAGPWGDALGPSVLSGALGGLPVHAEVDDHEDGPSCCSIRWRSDRDGLLAEGAMSTVALSPGVHRLTVEVVDAAGNQATDAIRLVVDNQPPTIDIVAPQATDTLVVGQSTLLQATVADIDGLTDPLCAETTWTFSTGEMPVVGCSQSVVFTTMGPRTITATVTDSHGASSHDDVSVSVSAAPETGPPLVTILSPLDGGGLRPSVFSILQGSALDPDDAGPLAFRWSVTDQNGNDFEISTLQSFFWRPDDTLSSSGCSTEDVTLELQATDADGQTGRDAVVVGVTYPPC